MSSANLKKAASLWSRKKVRDRIARPSDRIQKWDIVRGDKVVVTKGKDEGKIGVVKKVLRDENRLIVSGVNILKKRVPGTEQYKGRLITTLGPIQYSCVALCDPTSSKPCRAVWKTIEKEGKTDKVRISSESGEVIPRPKILLSPRKDFKDSPKDTSPDAVLMNSFNELSLIPPILSKARNN